MEISLIFHAQEQNRFFRQSRFEYPAVRHIEDIDQRRRIANAQLRKIVLNAKIKGSDAPASGLVAECAIALQIGSGPSFNGFTPVAIVDQFLLRQSRWIIGEDTRLLKGRQLWLKLHGGQTQTDFRGLVVAAIALLG